MAIKTIESMLAELKNDKVIQAIPKLNNLVKKIEKQYIKEDKNASKWCDVVSLMSDGMEYNEAMTSAGLNN